MITVNNSGNGNCGYYAYSISLMYFLRTQSAQTIATVLGRFSLSQTSLTNLESLLQSHKDITQPFSNQQLRLIEKTLGPACRALASNGVKKEFIAFPKRSGLYGDAAFGFFHEYSKIFTEDYRRYVKEPKDESGNYSEADLYKTPGMKNAMLAHAIQTAEFIQREFDTQCKELSSGMSADIEEREKIRLMDGIIRQQAIEFFQKNDRRYLEMYLNHLSTDGVWASEQMLFALHNEVTDGRSVYHVDSDTWVNTYGTTITLCILSNGINESGTKTLPEKSNIVLNNQANCHWVSVIPKAGYAPLAIADGNDNPSRQSGNSSCFFAKKSARGHSTSCVVFKTAEEKLDEALKCIKNKKHQAEYKPVLLSLLEKEHKPIDDIETAKALEGESDEAFAERLQIAELNAFLL